MTQTRASPEAAQGAWSALQAFAQTSALQNQALVAIRRPENRKNRVQLVKSGYESIYCQRGQMVNPERAASRVASHRSRRTERRHASARLTCKKASCDT